MIASARLDGLRSWVRNACRIRPAAACVAALVLAGYVAGILRPKLERGRQLRHEIAALELRRAAPTTDASPANSDGMQTAAQAVARPGELVPALSRLGRRSGLRIDAIKQTAGSAGAAERRIRVLAHGAFAAVVAFLDGIVGVLAQGQLEELALRHSLATNQIELEAFLRVKVGEPAVGAAGDDRQGGS